MVVVVWVARRGGLYASEVHAFALKFKNRADFKGTYNEKKQQTA